ncbi:hypothetical protein K4F52_006913 [Lecanicillium sp. MT-2017a]|nr:hypothetical protein K4F52_006913 [Lecanicillium sp. MT-2017a]
MVRDAKLDLRPDIPWSEPAWYAGMESSYYNDSHRRLRDTVRQFVDENILPHALDWEAKGEAPKEVGMKLIQSGIVSDQIPPEYRPANIPSIAGIPPEQMDAFHQLVLLDEMSRIEGGVTVSLVGANGVGLPPVIDFGTDEQKRKWLPGILTKETSFCLGITEPTTGSDVSNIQTSAKKTSDGKSYIVNGVKKWITGSQWATHMTTAVRTGGPGFGGISVLVIPLNSPGVTIEKIYNSGHNAGGASFVDLDNVEVPVENLLGEEDEGVSIIMNNFNKERFLMAVQCNRKARTCLALSFQYALDRHTFGKPLMSNQVIRKKLADLAQRVEGHWAWIEQLAFHVQKSPDGWNSPLVGGKVALLKVQGTQMLELASREAQQVYGGAGYQKAGPGATVEQISRDVRVMVVGGGSEEIMNDLAVRQELMMYQAKL